jgi:hypothetical protein
MTNKQQVNIRLAARDIAMLKQAATAYRSPSLNWFVQEMIRSMLNPAITRDFIQRLSTGTEQLTLALPAAKRAKPRKKKRTA